MHDCGTKGSSLEMHARLDQEDPNWRSEMELKEVRAFKTAALKMQDRKDRLVTLPSV